MRYLRCRTVVSAGLMALSLLVSQQALAIPFQSIDPRTLSMGGAGVASGTSTNASFVNPALLVTAKERKDFSVIAPILAWRSMDPISVSDELDRYQDSGFENTFDSALDDFRAPGGSADKKIVSALGNAVVEIIRQLDRLSDKPIEGEEMIGIVVGVPSKTLGVSVMVSVWSVGGAVLTGVAADRETFNVFLAELQTGARSPDDDVFSIEVDPAEGRTLEAVMEGRGAVFTEVGVSLAREFNIGGHDVVIGVTPKYVTVKAFDYVQPLYQASFGYDTDTNDHSNVNVDVGLTRDYSNGWKTGFVVKNLIPQSYRTVRNNELKTLPQMRLGFSRRHRWGTLALDIDLNESKAIGFDSKTQYLAGGAEFDLLDVAKVRVGYRHNIANSETAIITFGTAITLDDLHIEVGAGLNEDEGVFSAQLGYDF
ncbi:conjugal transfer protein TraF [Pseudomonadota bacterium]